jgi:threonine aldolase
MDTIDLRSDTVTWPTQEMREAMANAPVGDDVFKEDPTINKLEVLAAEMFGKEAAIFVPTGTMGNLVAILVHCRPGDEVIMGATAHTFLYEGGGISAVAGVMPHTLPVQSDGTIRLEDIEQAIRVVDDHCPTSRLICLENTHNKSGGKALSVEYTNSVAALAKKHGLKLHIDGARIFNAAADLKVDVKDLVAQADSITFCLSKGLCAPAGSLLLGSREFITTARRKRKMLGGGMRQAGVLAAAGLIALEKMAKRVHEDHENAILLAEGLSRIGRSSNSEGSKGSVEVLTCATNFVCVALHSSKHSAVEISKKLLDEYKINIGQPRGPNSFRLVVHYYITAEKVNQIVSAFEAILCS